VKLVVSNLRETVSSDALRTLFSGVGKVLNVQLSLDPQGRSLGTAEVLMANEQEAQTAVAAFNNVNVDKQPLRVVMVPQAAKPAAAAAPAPREKKAAPASSSSSGSAPAKKQQQQDKPRGGAPIKVSGGVQKQHKTTQKKQDKPRKEKPAKKGPKSAEELDRELEQFMGK
jgi:RNA recognition motif-containing protein